MRALTVSGNDLYAGGDFIQSGSTTLNHIARWNGTTWVSFGTGVGDSPSGPSVYALTISGTDLYVGGLFNTAGGNPATNVAKWNGTTWTSIGPGRDGTVLALAVLGNDLYAGGRYSSSGTPYANFLAKWDGNAWLPLDTGVDNEVHSLSVSGGDLYAGGYFGLAPFVRYVGRWDGNTWSGLGAGFPLAGVSAVVASGTNVYVGCEFTTATTVPVAKWDGTTWERLGAGLDNVVLALLTSNTNVYVAGQFTAAGGSFANQFVAEWNGTTWSAVQTTLSKNAFALGPIRDRSLCWRRFYKCRGSNLQWRHQVGRTRLFNVGVGLQQSGKRPHDPGDQLICRRPLHYGNEQRRSPRLG